MMVKFFESRVWSAGMITLAFIAGGATIYFQENLGLTAPESSSAIVHSSQPQQQSSAATAQPVVQAEVVPENISPDVTIPPIIDGLAPVISRIETQLPVVFLGIDDGGNKEPFELQMMKDNNVVASLFLADVFMNGNSDFFKDFIPAGSLIENHSVNHVMLSKLSYQEQKDEICTQADTQAELFGRRPVLFRPPFGDYNEDTQRAAADCGMKAVVTWIAKANGGSMQYQIGDSLRAGDIVLMHFRPEFKSDMQAFLDASKAAGLHTELLTDWLPAL